jgi:isoquinoline 1-oxidoreductase alpha subunit
VTPDRAELMLPRRRTVWKDLTGRDRLSDNRRNTPQGGNMARLNINGSVREVDVHPDTPLLWAIREQVGLTGTKYGCGIAECGACTVHVDGAAVRSCAMPVSAFNEGQKIVTIEGLSPDGSHPVQKAWLELDVPQCGYCQPGQIMSAAALLAQKPKPTDADINEITNICRCGTYNRIRAAIKLAAEGGEIRRGEGPAQDQRRG